MEHESCCDRRCTGCSRPECECECERLVVGQRVKVFAGSDSDTGIVCKMSGPMALVGWDSGVTTWVHVAELSATDEKHSGGHRVAL